MSWSKLFELCAPHGVVTADRAMRAGVSDRQLRKVAMAERWEQLFPGAWLLPGSPRTGDALVVGALEVVGDGALADRRTALDLHGVPAGQPRPVQLLLPHRHRIRTIRGIEVRRTRNLPDEHRTVVGGVRAVTVARALLDAARDHTVPALRSLALAARREGLLTAEDLYVVAAALPHAAGRRRILRVAADLARDDSDSELEVYARSRLDEAGFRPDAEQPLLHVHGITRRIDIAWVAVKVGIEVQSYRYHAHRAGLDRDATRLNALQAQGGWRVLQLTSTILYDRWGQFCLDLSSVLAEQARLLGQPVPVGVR